MGEQELPPGHPVEGQPEQPRRQQDAQVECQRPPRDDLEAENGELVLEALVYLGGGNLQDHDDRQHLYNLLDK